MFDDERAGFVDSMVPSESMGLELDGILGSLRVIGGGRFFPPAAGASRVGTGSSGTGAGAGVSETANCRALKLRFFRIGVAIDIKRENRNTQRVNKGISECRCSSPRDVHASDTLDASTTWLGSPFPQSLRYYHGYIPFRTFGQVENIKGYIRSSTRLLKQIH